MRALRNRAQQSGPQVDTAVACNSDTKRNALGENTGCVFLPDITGSPLCPLLKYDREYIVYTQQLKC
jgi:hypothetical protein